MCFAGFYGSATLPQPPPQPPQSACASRRVSACRCGECYWHDPLLVKRLGRFYQCHSCSVHQLATSNNVSWAAPVVWLPMCSLSGIMTTLMGSNSCDVVHLRRVASFDAQAADHLPYRLIPASSHVHYDRGSSVHASLCWQSTPGWATRCAHPPSPTNSWTLRARRCRAVTRACVRLGWPLVLCSTSGEWLPRGCA